MRMLTFSVIVLIDVFWPVSVESQSVDKAGEIIWTYDVKWEPSEIRCSTSNPTVSKALGSTHELCVCSWASRWDLYMYMGEDQVCVRQTVAGY